MTATPPSRINLPPVPTSSDIFARSSHNTHSHSRSHLTPTPSDTSPSGSPGVPYAQGLGRGRRRSAVRQSFSTANNASLRARRVSRMTNPDGTDLDIPDEELEAPKLPTLVPGIRPAYSTPLPVLPMVVLCLAMLSELLSANLATPFLLKMVEGFFLSSGHEKNSETEAAVGLWTGNLVSVFFITQFFTSLLWSGIADRHGRRAVIVASMAGSAIALTLFGTSTNLPEAICVRLVQGIFGGAVGVFRGSIRDLTDDTNETRAYALLGFSWGFGGVVGPILGGVFESPAQNYPGTFLANIPLFQSFPYILPTFLAGLILLTGAILACFLSWDGGVRGGERIALPVEKNEALAPIEEDRVHSPAPSARTAVPSLRGKRSMVLSPGIEESGPAILGASVPHARRDSRASLGTAYGYGGIRSKHPTLAARAALEAARRASSARPPPETSEEEEEEEPSLNFAQKLLLANEENTFNINDLWVSAAVAQETAVFDEDEDEILESQDEEDNDVTPQASPSRPDSLAPSFPPNSSSARRGPKQRLVSGASLRAPHRLSTNRRFSTASGQIPAIFSNTGLNTPPAIALPADDGNDDPFFGTPQSERRQPPLGNLSVITEGRAHERSPLVSPTAGITQEKPVSAWKGLPFMMILQYGLLALHNTTHDQVFLSFLTTPYRSGGIGLNPARFSLLIAIMCICQLFYQFYLYPRLGPPLGKFSHLQMFRLGCFFYIPSYFALPLLRQFASPDREPGLLVMTVLTLITAVRYCGGTLAYTSVMVLINVMSPPHVVGLANGLAQSTVSFARFFGPVIGGAVWSASINGNPYGYTKPFYIVTLGVIVQWSLSFLIR